MATCKDCIHYDICLDNGDDAAKQNAPNAEKECDFFKATADVVEVVRCKNCIWFVHEHIKLSDGTTRPYTDEEKKLPCGVTSDIGINVGSYCLRKGYWEQNGIPVWFKENDFCSYGERKTNQTTEIEHNSLCETKTYKR